MHGTFLYFCGLIGWYMFEPYRCDTTLNRYMFAICFVSLRDNIRGSCATAVVSIRVSVRVTPSPRVWISRSPACMGRCPVDMYIHLVAVDRLYLILLGRHVHPLELGRCFGDDRDPKVQNVCRYTGNFRLEHVVSPMLRSCFGMALFPPSPLAIIGRNRIPDSVRH